jgi:hypothetical protein
MTRLPDWISRATRPFVAILVLGLGLALSGCSAEGQPSPPGQTDSASGVSGTAPAVTGKKNAKSRPPIQAPGTVGYEDKPGARGRGR